MLQGDLVSKDLAAITQEICDRRGRSKDGRSAWSGSSRPHDVEIRLINADGSYAEISGNGTRCVAAHICATQRKDRITIQTGAGLKTCVLTERTESGYEFDIEMGEPVVGPELAVKLAAGEFRGIPVSMGNPHYVVFVRDFADDWQRTASEIQHNPAFKEHGVNIEMVVIDGEHDLRVRFFERGVGETQSSGTGSCAAAIAAFATGKASSPVRMHAPGGMQTVRKEGNQIFLRGPARLVCRGEFFLK